ncbi:hypothetical protein, partial [Mesorhizobium sp.]|uniref:hypothetical protein n=1 Tax=Mesorhizobium sp. TaxID=1871066 RepID=UPI0025B9F0F9
EAPGRPQRHHARQNRIRVNTVAMPLRQGVPTVAEFRTVALCGKGHGMDTRVRPEYDDVT